MPPAAGMNYLPIPPASLRAGIGPFEDPALFIHSGRDTVERARRMCGLTPSSQFLDVGCGCGRVALAMLDYLDPSGLYVGFDVDAECIDWCVRHVEVVDRRFHFDHLDIQSTSYNPGGAIATDRVTFPYGDSSFDCALVSSVFTHMAEAGITQYLAELWRVVKPGGTVLVSLLLINSDSLSAVERQTTLFSFNQRLGPNSWTIDPARPLEGVGISEAWFEELASSRDFRVEGIDYGNWRHVRSWEVEHDWLCLRRLNHSSAA